MILLSIAFLSATLKMFVVSFQLNKYQVCTNTESQGRGKTTGKIHTAQTNSDGSICGGAGTYRFSTQLEVFRGGGHLLHHLKGSVKVAWFP